MNEKVDILSFYIHKNFYDKESDVSNIFSSIELKVFEIVLYQVA